MSTPSGCPYELGAPRVLHHAQWAGLKEVPFVDPATGHKGVWQVAYRSTKAVGAVSDGAAVVAIVRRADGRHCFLLVRQYRIPCMAWCIEFPAGLQESDECIVACALRELREETGYVAHSAHVLHVLHAPMPLDPGIGDSTQSMVTVSLPAGDCPPVPSPQPGELHLTTVLVPCAELWHHVQTWTKQHNTVVHATVATFAWGYHLAKQGGLD